MLAVGAIVLTGTIKPEQAYSGFANSSVLLAAHCIDRRAGRGEVGPRQAHQPLHGQPLRRLVARPRLQHRAHRRGDRAGLPEQHGALAECSSRSCSPSPRGRAAKPEDPESRHLGGYLMFCSMAGIAVSSALWMTATSANPIAVQIVQKAGLEIDFGKVDPRLRGAVRSSRSRSCP